MVDKSKLHLRATNFVSISSCTHIVTNDECPRDPFHFQKYAIDLLKLILKLAKLVTVFSCLPLLIYFCEICASNYLSFYTETCCKVLTNCIDC